MDAIELAQIFPRTWHMAAAGAWESIRTNGLLSTSALLDLYGISGADRVRLEEQHRPNSVQIEAPNLEPATIRDQKPMSDNGLLRSLNGGLSPRDWYRILNGMTFFWPTPDRLLTMLEANAYRHDEHTVLTVDTESLVGAHFDRVRLSPMNSGATKPFPHPRGQDTFSTVADYPYQERVARRHVPLAEVAILDGVLDIADHVIEVRRMRGGEVLETIWEPSN